MAICSNHHQVRLAVSDAFMCGSVGSSSYHDRNNRSKNRLRTPQSELSSSGKPTTANCFTPPSPCKVGRIHKWAGFSCRCLKNGWRKGDRGACLADGELTGPRRLQTQDRSPKKRAE